MLIFLNPNTEFIVILFIYLFLFLFFHSNFKKYFLLAALGLRCCVQAFSAAVSGSCSLVGMGGLPIEVASLVAEHRL